MLHFGNWVRQSAYDVDKNSGCANHGNRRVALRSFGWTRFNLLRYAPLISSDLYLLSWTSTDGDHGLPCAGLSHLEMLDCGCARPPHIHRNLKRKPLSGQLFNRNIVLLVRLLPSAPYIIHLIHFGRRRSHYCSSPQSSPVSLSPSRHLNSTLASCLSLKLKLGHCRKFRYTFPAPCKRMVLTSYV